MLTIHVDGASRGNPGRAAAAAIIYRDGVIVRRNAVVLGDDITNNVAEYRALLGVLRWLTTAPYPYDATERIALYSDSKLIIEQASGRWNCKDGKLAALCAEAQTLLAQLALWSASRDAISLTWIPREQNAEADRLCNEVLDQAERRTA